MKKDKTLIISIHGYKGLSNEAIILLDTAKPSIKIAHPKNILVIFFGFFIAITLCIVYLFTIDIVSRKK